MMLVLLLSAGLLLYFGHLVEKRFVALRWSEPIHVFSRPLTIRIGMHRPLKQWRVLLKQYGYLERENPRSAGSFQLQPSRMVIHPRSEPGFAIGVQRVLINHDRGRIIEIRDTGNKQTMPAVSLAPTLIGSIIPQAHQDRSVVSLHQLPSFLVNALLAMEDRYFLQHHGIDFYAIARAIWINILSGEVVQGGSTITQQLAKNIYLSPTQTLGRKLAEAIIAIILELRYEKHQILEAYINEVYLGQDGVRAIHGFDLASRYYFNRPISEIRLEEAALLVAMLKGASSYNPRRFPEKAKQRRNLVLRTMRDFAMIDQESFEQAVRQPLEIATSANIAGQYSDFIDLLRHQLKGFRPIHEHTPTGVISTLDIGIQQAAQQALNRVLTQIEGQRTGGKSLQGAAVVVEQRNGAIRALVGNRYTHLAGFNHALHARRQIGSLIKPFVYLAALQPDQPYNLATLLDNRAITVRRTQNKIWQPRNYQSVSPDRVLLVDALAHSYNLATVRLGLNLGIERVVAELQNLGLKEQISPLPSLLLGAIELSPFQVARLYQPLANLGIKHSLHSIHGFSTKDDQWQSVNLPDPHRIADEASNALLDFALKMVLEYGTGSDISRKIKDFQTLRGKTGTTNHSRDSWFAGYSDRYLAVVWIGDAANKSTGLTGASGAMQVWSAIMHTIAIAERPVPRSPTASIQYFPIHKQTGGITTKNCPDSMPIPFHRGMQPRLRTRCGNERSTRHQDIGNDPNKGRKSWLRRFIDRLNRDKL